MITTVVPSFASKPSLAGNVARHEKAHSEFFFDSYSDFTTSNEQITKQMPSESYVASTNCTSDFCCNQQYSVTAITTAAGAIAERYAYTAYGLPTILNASATIIATSAISNRYAYTGREWDATLGLHHFRARWMSPIAGRFLGRDPIGFDGSRWNLFSYCEAGPLRRVDPSGLDWTINDFFNHWWWGHGKAVNLDTDAGLLGRYRSLHAGKIDPILDSTLAIAKSLINCDEGPGAYSRAGNLAKVNTSWSSWSVGPTDPLFVLGNSPISYVPSYTAVWLCEYCCASGGTVKVTSWTVNASVDFKLRDSFTNPYFVWEHDDQERARKQAACIQKAYLDFIRGKISEPIYRDRIKQCKKDYPTGDGPTGPISGGDPYAIFANWTETKSLSGSDPCL
jgi:RHS repeat-associated protein